MRLALALFALLASSPVLAHDYFLAPSKHRIDRGEPITITMRVGFDKEMDELPRNNRKLVRFDAFIGKDTQPVEGKHGESPAGRIAFDQSGVATIVFQSTHSDIELEAPKFEHYLEEEGLEEISAERAKMGVSASPGRESYARYVKTLVTVGDGDDGWNRRVGLPAELVALTDPRAGGTAQFQLFYQDKPRGNARVDVLRIEKDKLISVSHARTDDEGKVSLAIPGNGVWLVATTLMRQAPPELGLEGDWESFWVSIEFETGGKPKAKKGGCSAGDPGVLGIAFVLLAWLESARRRGRHEGKDRDCAVDGVDDGSR